MKNLRKGTFLISVIFGVTAFLLSSPSRIRVEKPLAADYTGMGNPAAVYCTDLGYQFKMSAEPDGEQGFCELPDGEHCDAWAFLQGECGKEYSACAQQGFAVETRSKGKNSFSRKYAVCVDDQGREIGSIESLVNLSEKALGCGGDQDSRKPPDTLSAPTLDAQTLDHAPPASFDWRNFSGGNWLPPVRNQAQCGSCWAFSAVGVTEAALNIAAGNPDLDKDLSEQYLVSDCHDPYNDKYQNCCGGYKASAMAYIRDSGIPVESCFSYVDGTSTYDGSTCKCGSSCGAGCQFNTNGSCSDTTCGDRCADWDTQLESITSYGYVGTDRTTIKNTLVEYGPLSVSLDMGGYWDGDIFRCSSEDGSTNHAVILTGYDDTGGYWVVRNSWGPGWNGDGYFNVGYGECSIENYVYFVSANLPPDAPSSPQPVDEGTNISPLTNLSWTGGDPNAGDTLTYDVYLEKGDTSPDLLACSADSETDCSPGVLEENTTYYWQVIAEDNHGVMTAGPIWELTIWNNTDWYVSNAGSDSNDCISPGSACETIQGAVDKAGDGDTVHAAAGTYPEYLHITHDLVLEGARAETTIIDPGGSSVGYVICNQASTTIRGFTITGTGASQTTCGWADGEGSAVSGGFPLTLERSIIRDNHRGVSGGSVVYLYNNLFINNAAWGMYASSWDQVVVYNNTFIDNDAGIAIFGGDASLIAKNNLFDGNTVGVKLTNVSVDHTVSYNLNNDGWEKVTLDGTNITGDPCFINRGAHDLHLDRCSAAIDAGVDESAVPDVDLDGESRPWAGGVDIGADESRYLAETPVADFDGDGTTDISVFRPSNGKWYIHGESSVWWGMEGDLPVPADYDGDTTTDLAVFRPSNGKWYVYGDAPVWWGMPDDVPLQGDYNGDGAAELTVFRPSNGKWYVYGEGPIWWGMTGDIPVPGDYDGDGSMDYALFRPSNGKWYVYGESPVWWGMTGDIPVPGDYDGDGSTDFAVYRPSNGKWYVYGDTPVWYGLSGDIPVPGDYDGDGSTDIAVLRPSNGKWYIKDQLTVWYYLPDDYPLPVRDTNGDGDPYQ